MSILSLHRKTHVQSQQTDDIVTCVLWQLFTLPLKYHPCGSDMMRREDVKSVCVHVCACNVKRPEHMGVLNLQLLLILPYEHLLAKDVNYMLMRATSELRVWFLSVSRLSVEDIYRERETSSCSWRKQKSDRLWRLTVVKMWENIQTLETFCPFPNWVKMIDHSEPTQRLGSNLEQRENKGKKLCIKKLGQKYSTESNAPSWCTTSYLIYGDIDSTWP